MRSAAALLLAMLGPGMLLAAASRAAAANPVYKDPTAALSARVDDLLGVVARGATAREVGSLVVILDPDQEGPHVAPGSRLLLRRNGTSRHGGPGD